MHVIITGAGGLIGGALARHLRDDGHVVTPLRRGGPASAPPRWDPYAGDVDWGDIDRVDAVVHLAGESIAGGRWTRARKRRILDSRVKGTRALVAALADLPARPRVLVCASAIGFYGDRGDEPLDEQSAGGRGFLADVCRQWEAEALAARAMGVRVVNARIGVVLSAHGGALPRMLTPFRLGLGGVIGDGSQVMSWVSLDDLVRMLAFCIGHDELDGPVNLVAPAPATNRAFTKTLGRVLRRPAALPLPAPLLRLLLGEMADALLLASAHVKPRRLTEAGYTWRHAALEPALRDILSA
jgi:uncharacterized protein (TIGR01777 family)